MHTQPSHPIHTTHDLATALCDLPDAMRVVVMRDGELVPCEVLVRRCGDWLVLEVCEMEVEER